MRIGRRYISLQISITLFVSAVVLVCLLVTGVLIGEREMRSTRANLADKAMTTAQIVANSPVVVAALEGKRSRSGVEPLAMKIQNITNVQFIVVMDMHHIRLSHPNQQEIGKRFVGGDENEAMHGKSYISLGRGTLGPSLRAFTPVFSSTGREVGVVSVGILTNHVRAAVAASLSIVYIGISVGVALGVLGAFLLARKIKSTLFGLEPPHIARLFEERHAILESVREGILAVDNQGRVSVANLAVIRMFRRAGLEGDPMHQDIRSYLPNTRLHRVLASGSGEYDQEFELNGVTFVVNRVPVLLNQEIVGAVATFREQTELKRLAEQLTGVKLYARALRVQAHEFMNRLHVILGLVHTAQYEHLSRYIADITHHFQMEVGAVSRLVKEPVLAGFLLSKLSYARERDVQLEIHGDVPLPTLDPPSTISEIVTILGNLIDNAFEAVEGRESKQIDILFAYDGAMMTFSVRDNGSDIPDDVEQHMYEKGFSTKGEYRGYGLYLVQQSIERLHGVLAHERVDGWTIFTVRLPTERKSG